MWRELIEAMTADVQPIGDLDPGPDFFPGVTSEQLDEVEHELGLHLPAPLRELLGESNGVLVEFGQHLIWNTDELVEHNRLPQDLLREGQAYRSSQIRQRLFFFGDAGVDGIRFGFPITVDSQMSEQVFAWYPIGDEQVHKASSLRDYIESWLSSRLTV